MTVAQILQRSFIAADILQWFPFGDKETSANGEQTLAFQDALMDSTASCPVPLQNVYSPLPSPSSLTSSGREEILLEDEDQTTSVAAYDKFASLERLSLAGDASTFAAVCKGMDWSAYSAEGFLRGIRLALDAGAHRTARWLAAQGAEQYPDHAELQKAARILAPPRVVRSNAPANIAPARNMQWLKTHGEDYRGRWVALRNGELLATAASYDELIEQVGNPKGTHILVTRVY